MPAFARAVRQSQTRTNPPSFDIFMSTPVGRATCPLEPWRQGFGCFCSLAAMLERQARSATFHFVADLARKTSFAACMALIVAGNPA